MPTFIPKSARAIRKCDVVTPFKEARVRSRNSDYGTLTESL
jgi:hypothetical protein